MAIVYDSNNQITIYRNGQVYATAANASLGSLQTYPAGVANILFGLRHSDLAGQAGSASGTDAFLAGSINEARIYSAALSAALAVGDLGVIALFGTPETATLPLLLYQRLAAYQFDAAAVTALVLLALCLLMFGLLERGIGGHARA